ncbi:phage GP46 family protein [Cupriavidus campinensis]|uniref:Phage GP46 family protein n=1 Tax=Cupriavidus campinensis TaxID=151783 RepID=A0AAE9HZI6_9BURK|nr:phage GP46 family protein [Cupriavidus campinensis]URF02785.1 phage GP46 family protein [Cupriavidus campinensis]
MSDITTVWSVERSQGDWLLSGPDLMSGSDLATAVLLSVFTDRTANPYDTIPDGTGDPRGWWGDQGETVPIGSRLWLLDRAKQNDDTLTRAHDYLTEGLQWLIDDGVAARVDVLVEWTRTSMLGANIVVRRTDGTTESVAFSWAWNGIS